MAELGDYDTVTVLLTTASGKQCVITNSRRATYGYDQRVEAFGSKGMAISENVRENNATFHGAGFTGRGAPLLDFFIERYGAAFAAEISAFVDAVETGSRARGRVRGRAPRAGAGRGGAEVGHRGPGRPAQRDRVSAMYQKFGLFIGGSWTGAAGGATAPVISPVTEQPLGEAPVAARADTEAAIAAAERRARRLAGEVGLRAGRRAARHRRRDDPPQGRGGADDRDRDRQADRAGRARVGPLLRPVPLVRRGGAAHLRPHRREPRAGRTLRGHPRADRHRRGLHRLELPRGAGGAQGGAGAGGGLFGDRPAVEPDAGHGDGDGRLLPGRQPARRRGQPRRRPDRRRPTRRSWPRPWCARCR